jgi:hypothetical protein
MAMSLPPEGSSPKGDHSGQAKRRSDYVPFLLLPFDEPMTANLSAYRTSAYNDVEVIRIGSRYLSDDAIPRYKGELAHASCRNKEAIAGVFMSCCDNHLRSLAGNTLFYRDYFCVCDRHCRAKPLRWGFFAQMRATGDAVFCVATDNSQDVIGETNSVPAA